MGSFSSFLERSSLTCKLYFIGPEFACFTMCIWQSRVLLLVFENSNLLQSLNSPWFENLLLEMIFVEDFKVALHVEIKL